MSLPATRQEARMIGATRYQRSKPCKNGHMGAQYVHGGCCECRANTTEAERKLAVRRSQAWRGRRYRELASDLTEKARSTGVGCRLTVVDIIRLYNRVGVCSITGDVIIRPGVNGQGIRQAALRRINLDEDWVPGNVEIVSMRATLAESEASNLRFA